MSTAGGPPAITGLSPAAGSQGGGTSVVITGTGSTGATGVTFGGTAATSFHVDSDTQITAIAPAHTVGAVQVQVATARGATADTPADDYTYVAPPVPGTSSDQELLKKVRGNRPSGDIFLPSALPDGWVLLTPPFPDVFDNGVELPDIQEDPIFHPDGLGGRVWYILFYQTASGDQVMLRVDSPSSLSPEDGEPAGMALEGNEWRTQTLGGDCLSVWLDADQMGEDAYEINIWSEDGDYATEKDIARLMMRVSQ